MIQNTEIQNWRQFENGKSVGKTGFENGTIIYDIEYARGARVTLHEKTEISPFLTTIDVYGHMLHTRADDDESVAMKFISESKPKIENLLDVLGIPETARAEGWGNKINRLTEAVAENQPWW